MLTRHGKHKDISNSTRGVPAIIGEIYLRKTDKFNKNAMAWNNQIA